MVDNLQKTFRGQNAILNIFELWVGLAGIISGIVFFYAPLSISNNAISQQIGHSWSIVWNVCYFLAGVAIWYGLLRPAPRFELAGLWILGGATAIEGIAIISVFGTHGAATAITLLALTAASWVRALLVYRAIRRLAHLHAGR